MRATLLLVLAWLATPGPALAADASPAAANAPVLTLADALSRAKARNLDLKVAQEQLAQSKEAHVKAWSYYLPQVTASGAFTHTSTGDVTFPATVLGAPAGTPDILISKQNQLTGQLQATQTLVSPRAFLAIVAARQSETVSAENVESTRRDILFGVAQAYYGAAAAKQIMAVQERQLMIARQHERDARIRVEAGSATRITLLRAEIDRARAEEDLKRAQSSYDSARVAISTLLDEKDAGFDVEVPPTPAVPQGDEGALVSQALRDRPDARAAIANVDYAEKSREAVFGRYFPDLGAFGHIDYSNAAGFGGDSTTWAVGLQLSWTIFDGFLRESDLRDASSRIRQAQSSRAGTEARVLDEVRRNRLDLDAAVANREKAKEQLEFARENQRLVDVNYRAGAATALEVSDANTALLQAELTLVSESLNADLSALRVVKAVGAFNP